MAARKPSFNFGASAKPRKPPRAKKAAVSKPSVSKSNAWRSYTGVSNVPIPD